MKDLLRDGWRATGIFSTIVLNWTVAQYQLIFERMDNQVVRFATGFDSDIDTRHLRYDLLQSKFNILSQPSLLTSFFREIPKYRK